MRPGEPLPIPGLRAEAPADRLVEAGQVLQARTARAGDLTMYLDLLSVAWPAPWGASATDGAYPVPADVRTVISYALEHGWQPVLRGGTFVLSEREHAVRFSLPGFLLTDRLRTPDSADPTDRVIRAYEARRQD